MTTMSTTPRPQAPRHDIQTVDGHYFDFLQPQRSVFNVGTIAHALGHLCRFTGHTRSFYSVAQHSVLVSMIVPSEHALAALVHDAAEAFVGDVARPLKNLLPEYKVIEKRIEAEVLRRFGLPAELPACVKHADNVLLATERRDLMRELHDTWEDLQGVEVLPWRIEPLAPELAREYFLARYYAITRGRLLMAGPDRSNPSSTTTEGAGNGHA